MTLIISVTAKLSNFTLLEFNLKKHLCYNKLMVKIAESLISLYKLALPFCDRKKIALNLDISDPSLSLKMEKRQLDNILKPFLQGSITRTKSGAITLGSKRDQEGIKIFVKDTGEAIPKSKRTEMMTDENIEIHSRHGYGTTITVIFN